MFHNCSIPEFMIALSQVPFDKAQGELFSCFLEDSEQVATFRVNDSCILQLLVWNEDRLKFLLIAAYDSSLTILLTKHAYFLCGRLLALVGTGRALRPSAKFFILIGNHMSHITCDHMAKSIAGTVSLVITMIVVFNQWLAKILIYAGRRISHNINVQAEDYVSFVCDDVVVDAELLRSLYERYTAIVVGSLTCSTWSIHIIVHVIDTSLRAIFQIFQQSLHFYTPMVSFGFEGYIFPRNFSTIMLLAKDNLVSLSTASCTMVIKLTEKTTLPLLFCAHISKQNTIPFGVFNVPKTEVIFEDVGHLAAFSIELTFSIAICQYFVIQCTLILCTLFILLPDYLWVTWLPKEVEVYHRLFRIQSSWLQELLKILFSKGLHMNRRSFRTILSWSSNFIAFDLEDKVNFKGGGNVTNATNVNVSEGQGETKAKEYVAGNKGMRLSTRVKRDNST